jgi:aminopeptidase N
MVASPDFQVTSQTVDGTQINSYFLRGYEPGGEAALQVASGSLEIYNQLIGSYPCAELDVVQAPMRYASGVEYPSIFLIHSGLYDDPQDMNFIITAAHEVAHQWWYNLVGNDVFDDPWLDEALATYTSALYLEYEIGAGGYAGYLREMQNEYRWLASRNMDTRVIEELSFFESAEQPSLLYGAVVYTKGGIFFHELRETIGDAAFYAGLQNYFDSQIYQVARVEDLLNAFENASGQSLDEFYEQWLYSP